jgi:hypothetical protein
MAEIVRTTVNKFAATLTGLSGFGMVLLYWFRGPDDGPTWLVVGIVLLICSVGIYLSPRIEKAFGLSQGKKRDRHPPNS